MPEVSGSTALPVYRILVGSYLADAPSLEDDNQTQC